MNQGRPEKQLRRQVRYRGRVVDLFVDQVLGPDQRKHIREVVGHRPAVAMVPLLPDGRVLLVRQFRYAVGKWLWELPAGLVERTETPRQAALRELREETGYRSRRLQSLGSFFSSPGFNQEKIGLFLARALAAVGPPALDPDEFLICRALPWKTALAWVDQGKIADGKTILGLLLARERLKKEKTRL